MALPNKPFLQASPKGKTSSTKAHNGSSKNGHSSSHKHTQKSHKSKDDEKADIVERFVRDERDHRSYAVSEFDAHQEAARRRHRDELASVVGKGYD